MDFRVTHRQWCEKYLLYAHTDTHKNGDDKTEIRLHTCVQAHTLLSHTLASKYPPPQHHGTSTHTLPNTTVLAHTLLTLLVGGEGGLGKEGAGSVSVEGLHTEGVLRVGLQVLNIGLQGRSVQHPLPTAEQETL
jgi:hypothetical protein